MEDFILPSPKKLAKKEDTRTVSLRVKEKTMTAFEKYAKQNDTTASALINGVLDSYIAYWQQKDLEQNSEEYQKRDKNAAKKVMSQYLEKLASRMERLSDIDLCVSLYENNENYFWTTINDAEDFVDYMRKGKTSEVDEVISVFSGDPLHREFACSDAGGKSDIENCTGQNGNSPMIFIPAEKFPIAGYMILQYIKKNKSLYEGKRKQLFSDDTDRQIVNIVNEAKVDAPKDRVIFAKKLSKVLSEFEGGEDE